MKRCGLHRKPFSNNIRRLPINGQEEFMDLNTNPTTNLKFTETEPTACLATCKKLVPPLSKRAVAKLQRPAYANRSFKLSLHKNAEPLRTIDEDVRAILSTIAPNFDPLCSIKQVLDTFAYNKYIIKHCSKGAPIRYSSK